MQHALMTRFHDDKDHLRLRCVSRVDAEHCQHAIVITFTLICHAAYQCRLIPRRHHQFNAVIMRHMLVHHHHHARKHHAYAATIRRHANIFSAIRHVLMRRWLPLINALTPRHHLRRHDEIVHHPLSHCRRVALMFC